MLTAHMHRLLESYVATCRAKGASDQVIAEVLVGAGWSNEVVQELLQSGQGHLRETSPSILPAAQKLLSSFLVTSFRVVGFCSLLMVSAGVGAVAAAEQGYLPEFSQVYRRTPLPLVWGGTTAAPSLTLARALQASVDGRQQTKLVLSLGEGQGRQVVLASELPLLGNLFRQRSMEGRSFASYGTGDVIGQDVLGTPNISDPNDTPIILPAALEMQGSWRIDSNQRMEAQFSLPVVQLEKAFPLLSPLIAPSQENLQVEVLHDPTMHKTFLRSEALPELASDDRKRWFSSMTPALPQERTRLRALDELLRRTVTDKGIVQNSGQVRAHYYLRMEADELRRLLRFLGAESELQDDYLLEANIFTESRSARIREMDVKLTRQIANQVAVQLEGSSVFTYEKVAQVMIPEDKEVHTLSLSNYLATVFQTGPEKLRSPGMLSEEAFELFALPQE